MRPPPTTAQALLLLLPTLITALNSQCTESTSVCFSLGVAPSAAESAKGQGKGDIYIQLAADASKYTWISLAQGVMMAGANYFLGYTAADGRGVTLSTRKSAADSHQMPVFVNSGDNGQVIEVLPGSGVNDGVLVVNLRCGNCSSWGAGDQAGGMDFSQFPTRWVWAFAEGRPLGSDYRNAVIPQHTAFGSLSFDETARLGGESNPFGSLACGGGDDGEDTAITTFVTSTQTSTMRITMSSGAAQATSGGRRRRKRDTVLTAEQMVRQAMGLNICRPESSSKSTTTAKTTATISPDDPMQSAYMKGGLNKQEQRQMILSAHSVLASLAFMLFFPLGGIVMRLVKSRYFPTMQVHIGLQGTGSVFFVAAMGLGVWLATHDAAPGTLSKTHPAIGLLLFALLPIQGLLGFVHHSVFLSKRKRSIWTHVHLWLGRFVVTFGLITGITGFTLSGHATSPGAGAFYFFAVVVWLGYVYAVVRDERARRQRALEAARLPSLPKAHDHFDRDRHHFISNNNRVIGERPIHESWMAMEQPRETLQPRRDSSAEQIRSGHDFSLSSREIEVSYFRQSDGSGLSPRLPRKSFASSRFARDPGSESRHTRIVSGVDVAKGLQGQLSPRRQPGQPGPDWI